MRIENESVVLSIIVVLVKQSGLLAR